MRSCASGRPLFRKLLLPWLPSPHKHLSFQKLNRTLTRPVFTFSYKEYGIKVSPLAASAPVFPGCFFIYKTARLTRRLRQARSYSANFSSVPLIISRPSPVRSARQARAGGVNKRSIKSAFSLTCPSLSVAPLPSPDGFSFANFLCCGGPVRQCISFLVHRPDARLAPRGRAQCFPLYLNARRQRQI